MILVKQIAAPLTVRPPAQPLQHGAVRMSGLGFTGPLAIGIGGILLVGAIVVGINYGAWKLGNWVGEKVGGA